MQIRSISIAVILASVIPVAAYAADMPVKAVAPAPVVYSWTGFYGGFNAGAFWRDDSYSADARPTFDTGTLGSQSIAQALAIIGTTSGNIKDPGFVGGLQAGYNWQLGAWVAGVEADIQLMKGGSHSEFFFVRVPNFPNESYSGTRNISSTFDYFGTVRGRLGYLWTPNLLVYATGGLAYADVNVKGYIGAQESLGGGAYNSLVGQGFFISDTRFGWTAGGGFEWKLDRYWSAKLEYLHYDLGSVTGTNALYQTAPVLNGILFGAAGGTAKANLAGDMVRFGVNYWF